MLYAVKNDEHYLIFSKGNMPAYTNDISQATVTTMSEIVHYLFEWGRKAERMVNMGSPLVTKPHYIVEAMPTNRYTAGAIL